jgi:hypothetical protein
MENLTYGRKKPEAGDKGRAFFPALAANAVLDDAHTHDGNDSAPIPASNLTRGARAVTGTGWSASGVMYRKLVTFPGDYTWGACQIQCFLSGGDDDAQECHPKLERASSTTFYVYMPVDNQALNFLFT